MSISEVKVPDIGDFQEVEVIEVICKEGQSVAVEDPLITLESDKATMDIPSPMAGRILSIKIKSGDKVFIPKIPSSVTVVGEVMTPGSLLWNENKTANSYANQKRNITIASPFCSIKMPTANGRRAKSVAKTNPNSQKVLASP